MRKGKTLTQHALLRAAQRYSADFGTKDLHIIVKLIQNGESEFVCKQSNTRTQHKVYYKGMWYGLIYDKKRELVVTFLPQEKQDD